MEDNKQIIRTIIIAIAMLGIAMHKKLPLFMQIGVVVVLAIYFLFELVYNIYKRSYWEKIMTSIIVLIVCIILSIVYYKCLVRIDKLYIYIMTITCAWMPPPLLYLHLVSMKRKGDIQYYKRGLIGITYFLIVAVVATIIIVT